MENWDWLKTEGLQLELDRVDEMSESESEGRSYHLKWTKTFCHINQLEVKWIILTLPKEAHVFKLHEDDSTTKQYDRSLDWKICPVLDFKYSLSF